MALITLVTDNRYVAPKKITPYVANILKEYELLRDALLQEGFSVDRVAWDDTSYDWHATDAVVIRTTWDYYERFEEFEAWVTKVDKQTLLLNSRDIIQWNVDKNYLCDLQKQGLPIVPTFFAAGGSELTLSEISDEQGWDPLIVKPAIGAAAFLTYRLQGDAIEAFESTFSAMLQERDLLIQSFQETITSRGEASLMVFGGTFTHAILKKAKAGDFRVQDDFGGTVHPYTPTTTEIVLAETAMQACQTMPVYGRVDIMWNDEGAPMISELELIEPEIWLRNHPPAAVAFAQAIKTRMAHV